MLTRQIALVPTGVSIPLGNVAQVANALHTQVSRDYANVWGVDAAVSVFEKVEDVPHDTFVIQLVSQINQAGVEGFHYFDQGGFPHAVVMVNANTPHWSLAASHECLEMLTDPSGRRLQPGPPPGQEDGLVQYLLEVCDPCQSLAYAYGINGFAVSDFYGPNFFESAPRSGTRYSLMGHLTGPRQLLPGGYLCWVDSRGLWHKLVYGDNGLQEVPVRGMYGKTLSYREAIDRHSRKNGQASLYTSQGTEHQELLESKISHLARQREDSKAFGVRRAHAIASYYEGKLSDKPKKKNRRSS